MNVTQQGIVTLLKSAITGEKYELPKEFDLNSEDVKTLIKKHYLMYLVYIGALNCGISSEHPTMQSMFMLYCKHMLYSENQMKEVQKIFRKFDENKIDYLPTKGCKLKALYPKPEMRTMGDADITVREEQREQIGQILTDLGFTLSSAGVGTDVWDSKHLHLELHRHMNSFYNEAYYDDIWERAELLNGSQYRLKTEDEFIHIFNHFARHYRCGGIGIRHVMDLYVFRRTYPDMNEAYICEEMKKIHLQKFYQNMCALLDVWFSNGVETEETDSISEYIFNSGSWGDLKSRVAATQVKMANETGATSSFRFRAIWRTIFPDLEFMKVRYAILEKYPFFLPVTWVLRWGKAVTISRKYVPNHVTIWKHIDDEKVVECQKQFRMDGLDIEDEIS